MHEMSLASAVHATALKHAKGRKVKVVSLTVGALRQVVPDSLEFYFEIVGRDTLCDGARLEVEMIPGRVRCEPCQDEWELELPLFRCPHCFQTGVEVLSGNEFQVESIEVEEDQECIAQR